ARAGNERRCCATGSCGQSSARSPILLASAYSWSMIPRVEPEGRLFRKPVSTPYQVRGKLFRDHALASGQSGGRGPRDAARRGTASRVDLVSASAASGVRRAYTVHWKLLRRLGHGPTSEWPHCGKALPIPICNVPPPGGQPAPAVQTCEQPQGW